MFTTGEIAKVDESYFEVVHADGIAVEVRSRNITGEYDPSMITQIKDITVLWSIGIGDGNHIICSVLP